MKAYLKKLVKGTLMAMSIVSAVDVSAAGGGLAAPGSDSNAYGAPSVWASSMKQGIGTSYEKYNTALDSFGHTDTGVVSKVWFSLAEGILTETAWGLIHEAQLKDMQFLITGSSNGGWFDEERLDTYHSVTYLNTNSSGKPLSPAYRIVNTDKDGRYSITKDVFTDPDRQALFMRVRFQANEDGITPYLLVNPHIANTGNEDVAFVGTSYLGARDTSDSTYLVVKSSAAMTKTSAAYVGVNDGWTDLHSDLTMNYEFDNTSPSPAAGKGNVALTAQFATLNSSTLTFDITLGFGNTFTEAESNAVNSLSAGYSTVLANYNGSGSYTGWEDYIAGLSPLSGMVSFTGDNGELLYSSALMLKTMEDKTNAGALIACLCVPWGETVSADYFNTGYRAVWVRDFFQVGMALLALGDTDTAKVAFKYLPRIQVTASTPGVGSSNDAGWFLQKTHVDGTLEWIGLQKDQAAMPIMYAWKLWKSGVLSGSELTSYYNSMLKPAAEFLSHTSSIDLTVGGYHNTGTYDIFETQQERWEEEAGRSPSTSAAVIAGLITAADIADFIGGGEVGAASWYRQQADAIYNRLNDMYTTSGSFGDGEYFFRIDDPGSSSTCINNGGTCVDERAVLDGGFLELVRYGVLEPDDFRIQETVEEYNNQTLNTSDRVRYDFNFDGTTYPGWRRYSQDRYGEKHTDCTNFTGDNFDNRGRVWSFFSGEYGTFKLDELFKAHSGSIPSSEITLLTDRYARAMELFANDTNLLPEQIYDGECSSGGSRYTVGEGTNSATPLAWPHAEYIKLVRSLMDKANFSSFHVVNDRYPLNSGTVPVTFRCSNGDTIMGQSVYVVGNIPELGNWDPGSALILSPTSYPTWIGTYDMPSGTSFEWKGIKRWEDYAANSSVIWEPGNNNVTTTPTSGFITVDCEF